MSVDLTHISSANGLLKLSHVLLGGISLTLLTTSYVPFWALDVFILSVATCFGISTLFLVLYLCLPHSYRRVYFFTLTSSIFHTLAGLVLIVAGIDLIGWSDYDKNCGFNCPRIYYIGVAKILTFINGTLYAIHGFLEARSDYSTVAYSHGDGHDHESQRHYGDLNPSESMPLLSNSQGERSTILPPAFSVLIQPPSDAEIYNPRQNDRNSINR